MNQTRKVVSCAKEDALPEFPKRKDSPGRILVRPASRIRAVIVDDDENDRLLTGSVLARIPGVESVASFASAEEALNGVSASAVDIVLMDFQMPGMDGIECTRKLKARMPHLKILMLTGMCDSKSIYESQRAGADGYLTKPLCPTQLMAWITFSWNAVTPLQGVTSVYPDCSSATARAWCRHPDRKRTIARRGAE